MDSVSSAENIPHIGSVDEDSKTREKTMSKTVSKEHSWVGRDQDDIERFLFESTDAIRLALASRSLWRSTGYQRPMYTQPQSVIHPAAQRP